MYIYKYIYKYIYTIILYLLLFSSQAFLELSLFKTAEVGNEIDVTSNTEHLPLKYPKQESIQDINRMNSNSVFIVFVAGVPRAFALQNGLCEQRN